MPPLPWRATGRCSATPSGRGPSTETWAAWGRSSRSEWTATGVAGAHFADTAGVALRTPLTVVTRQPRPDGPVATATLSGSARSMLCLAVWSVPADGPLGWLARKQPFASFRVRDATLSLG